MFWDSFKEGIFPLISSHPGGQGGSAGTQRNRHHLSQQQQQAALPGGGEPGQTHRVHPAPSAPQLTAPPRAAEEGKTESQAEV